MCYVIDWLATVPSLGVPIETVSPKTKTKSTVSAASEPAEKTMFVLLIVKVVDGACITPEMNIIHYFLNQVLQQILSKTFVKANVVVEPSGVIVLHLI